MPKDDKMNRTSIIVEPKVLKGFQDILPEEAIMFNNIIGKVRNVAERFGFLPMDTPALEYLATLVGTAGEDTTKQIFRLKSPEHEDIGLRFDLTVPLARFVAQHLDELKLPFRRYHIAPAWRTDKPGPGRFRQFTQFDFDAVGSANMAVDAEIVRFICDVMTQVNVSEYVVLTNHRKIMNALLETCRIMSEQQYKHVLRVIDKLDRIGIEEVRKELGKGRVDASGDQIEGVGLEYATIKLIEEFLNVSGDTREEIFEGIHQVIPETEKSKEAFTEVQNYLNALESLGVEEKHVKFLPSLTRGLDYYTGPVFETILPKAIKYGSVMGGGRFDGLIKRFSGTDIPATGGSIGISRFLSALADIGALPSSKTTTKVLVTVMEQRYMSHYLSIATELRGAGINTEVYLGRPNDSLATQLALANKREIPIAIIVGEDEFKNGTISIKDLHAGKELRKDIVGRKKYIAASKAGQIVIPRADFVSNIQQMLG